MEKLLLILPFVLVGCGPSPKYLEEKSRTHGGVTHSGEIHRHITIDGMECVQLGQRSLSCNWPKE